ncbi:hypothetical protein ACQVPI_22175 [Bacillus wiedmannii]
MQSITRNQDLPLQSKQSYGGCAVMVPEPTENQNHLRKKKQ